MNVQRSKIRKKREFLRNQLNVSNNLKNFEFDGRNDRRGGGELDVHISVEKRYSVLLEEAKKKLMDMANERCKSDKLAS